MKKVFKLAALITMVAMIAAMAMLPVMAEGEPEETEETTVETEEPGETGEEETTVEEEEETTVAGTTGAPAAETASYPTNEDGSVDIGGMTIKFNEDGTKLLVVTNKSLPSVVFGAAATITGVKGKPSYGQNFLGAFQDAGTGGIAANEPFAADVEILNWDVNDGVTEVTVDGVFYIKENTGIPTGAKFTVKYIGEVETTEETTTAGPVLPGRVPGPNSNYPQVTTAAPAAGGVPRGGVVLAIIPTMIAAGAAIVSSRKRK
ncbi:MAG: hypothetical protein FWF94_00860 [Oscillospiraceae bacterium]|nr:hypothetical protein [Oscillospiraceae bacterium]